MARHYSNKDFFRQMPNALLARYFQARGLFNDLDFSAMKEGKPDELFAAWLTLMEGQRNAMDAEFRDIFEMSCEKGFRAIIDEAEFQLGEDMFTAWVERLLRVLRCNMVTLVVAQHDVQLATNRS